MTSPLVLPIDEFIPSIAEHMQRANNLVITASPGAGKTTRLPPALSQVLPGKVVVLEPRRMAAIAAAHRIAEEQKWQLGQEVGYQVRFANKTSPTTKLIFMTEALLARQMIQDPELKGVSLVILDEFHERSVHVDLALGLLRELQELGSEIKILVMSATLEAEKISQYLGQCPIVNVPGKLFPLEIRHQKSGQLVQTFPNFFENLFQVLKEAQAKTSRDILVFLPGVGEISRTQGMLQSWAETKGVDVVPLHGSLNIDEQRRALQKSPRQRVLLSTNIAESSVTVDGVDTVIDSGLVKILRHDQRTGFSRLELGRISLSSAIQRAGRAARQFPGVCYRLWNKMDEVSFSKSDIAEIQRIDLSESLLFLSAQGVTDFSKFSWFEKPSSAALQNAQRFLEMSSAINSDHKVTALGTQMLHFPLPVRLAKMMLMGAEISAVTLASEMAALLQERDLLRRDQIAAFIGDNLECDLSARLEVLQQFRRGPKSSRESSYFLLQTVSQAAQQIEDLAKKLLIAKSSPNTQDQPRDLVKKMAALAYADRLCRRRGKSDRALMVGGRGVKLQAESLVKESEFFVALNGVEGNSDAETLISMACGFSKEFVLQVFQDQIIKTKEVTFIEEKGQCFVREYRSLHGLALDEPSLTPASAEDIADKLPSILNERFSLVLKSNEKLAHWWQRLEFLCQQQSINLDLEKYRFDAFVQACFGEKKMQTIMEKDLVFFFENSFPSDVVHTLRQEVPDRIEVPSGSKIQVHYPLDKNPYLEVRIQEIFGLSKTPHIYFDKIPITLHLLSPNFRPVQVTSNLESFWASGYQEVRKELRLRYPKHQWPEDPADGVPEAKGRKRF